MRNPSPDQYSGHPRGNDGRAVAVIVGISAIAANSIENTDIRTDTGTSPCPTMQAPSSLDLPSHEVLAQLARDDPQAYEAYRRKIVDEFIDRAPERLKSRLSGIQFRVDTVRQLSRTSALGATVRVYALMWKSFKHLNEVWQELMPIENGRAIFRGNRYSKTPGNKCTSKQEARILAFRPRLHCD